MASMQMCKPACQGTYKETEKVKYSSSSEGYCSTEHKQQEHNSSGYSMTKEGQHAGGMQCMKHPCQNCNCSQSGYVSEHKQAGCAMNQGGHRMGGMTHEHPSHSATGHHHGLTEKITGYFSHNSSHQGHHDRKHGRHSSNHHASYGYTEKMEEHTSCKSGNMKCTTHIKKKSTWKGNCKDGSDSSENESANEGCKKKLARTTQISIQPKMGDYRRENHKTL